ncbi:MAG TPA: LysE family translocator [Acidimicrobiales bacterium]|nr:LysE family translocator [Acidimicrobiales bacterium]
MTLERRYRRLIRLYPAAWRARYEDEVVGTLLDAAGPGRDSVSPAEAADLVRGAVVQRVRALAAAPGPGRGRATARLAGTVAAAAGAAVAVVLVGVSVGDVPADFLLTSLVVAAVPGTGVLYTVSSSISGGWRRGLPAAVGCTFGIVPHVLAAMLGLSGLMQAGAAAFEAVRWLGVAYLVFMGVSMLRDRGALRVARRPDGPGEPASVVVRRGVLVNLLNPKLTVFFFAFLPQFLDTPPGLLDPRLVGLGAVFMLATLVVFVVYAWASAAVRERVLGTPALLRWVQRSLGTLVIGFAARLATADR